MIYAASGHRAASIGTSHPPMQLKLVDFAQSVLRVHKPSLVLVGMALGWDQAVARAAIREGIPFEAFTPFPDQQKFWHSTDRAAYRVLLSEAAEVHVEDPSGEMFWRDALMSRNESMVDRAQAVLGLWDGRKWGGTFQCLLYAQSKGIRVHQLYQDWQSFSS